MTGQSQTTVAEAMNQATRKGFTLVEMLVVIVIISMLAGLLIPAISGARARARRTQCGNNQHELAVAFQQYENAKQRLPGYVNRYPAVSATGQSFSWPVVLLEYLGRNDLWEIWRDVNIIFADKTDPLATGFAAPTISQFVCPADTFSGDSGLSYVANCGREDDPTSGLPGDRATNGLFHDRFTSSGATPNPNEWVTIMTERIPDGAAQTILFSENNQARYWYDVDEAYIGMVWVQGPQDANANNLVDPGEGPDPPPPVPTPPGDPDVRQVNMQNDAFPTAPSCAPSANFDWARPSSYHPSGVVVTYADGHQGFLDEGVEYDVYRSQMVPDDNGAKSDGEYFLP